ncbi:hypothetical protein F751_3287 [Auxenochlorella protothecoides]|uniref:Uncharacterized protein n=1 Tax=Auxenochlorella protothecoides TaxID=3075 RepID=A0A087SBJ2_AUXPR|nr:hypothetical protein F751_3287 [Auxenochlorella protothecoides]KFM23096.1 hypothetical protein F751_3287 [Auxenochlorella protothecoides]
MCVHGRDSSSFRRRNLKASETATAIATAVASGDTAAAAEAIATALGEGSGAEIPPAQITDPNAIVAALQGKAQSSPSMTINPSAPDVTELKESIASALAMAVADVCHIKSLC